jgi:hypothetical protein
MKRLIVFLSLAVFFVAASPSAQMAPAGKPIPTPKPHFIFFDDFNDNDAAGWSFTALAYPGGGIGNWRVVDGQLVQDLGGDHYKALVENIVLSNQSIEVSMNVHEFAYGGVTLWFQDEAHWVEVWSYPGYGRFEVYEINGHLNAISTAYDFNYPGGVWNRLRVDANSKSGALNVYMDDVFLFTHKVTLAERTGLSGVNCGNAGATFDDFKLSKFANGKK